MRWVPVSQPQAPASSFIHGPLKQGVPAPSLPTGGCCPVPSPEPNSGDRLDWGRSNHYADRGRVRLTSAVLEAKETQVCIPLPGLLLPDAGKLENKLRGFKVQRRPFLQQAKPGHIHHITERDGQCPRERMASGPPWLKSAICYPEPQIRFCSTHGRSSLSWPLPPQSRIQV